MEESSYFGIRFQEDEVGGCGGVNLFGRFIVNGGGLYSLRWRTFRSTMTDIKNLKVKVRRVDHEQGMSLETVENILKAKIHQTSFPVMANFLTEFPQYVTYKSGSLTSEFGTSYRYVHLRNFLTSRIF